MVRSREDAVVVMNKQTKNKPGTCQMTTRGWYDAPSAGDRDHDGDADANDGWLSEPVKYRHLGDRNPPKGVPVYFRNKSKTGPAAYGHRAATNGPKGACRSTDMAAGRYTPGVTGNATIAQIEREMGLIYVGWSESITAQLIPMGPGKTPKPDPSYGPTKAPKRVPASWSGFVHLPASKFMDYLAAIEKAAELGKGVDIDIRRSKNGTAWAAHWETVGQNHAHDPKGKIKASAKLSSLTDAEIDRLRGPNGQKAFRRANVLIAHALKHGVRVELEVKVQFTEAEVKRVMGNANTKKLHNRHLLQIKTLAVVGRPLARLVPWKKFGAITILTFTGYKGKGINKKYATPVVDYFRGNPKWAA